MSFILCGFFKTHKLRLYILRGKAKDQAASVGTFSIHLALLFSAPMFFAANWRQVCPDCICDHPRPHWS